MNIRWCGAVVGAAAIAVAAGAASANPSAAFTVRTVTPIRTIPLRNLQNPDALTTMRQVMANRYYTSQRLDLLRGQLIHSGYLAPGGHKFTIPVLRMTPAMSQAPRVRDPVRQSKFFGPQPNSITSGVGFAGIGASDTPADPIGCAPPDTNAAVGNGYVVEIVNLCNTGVGEFKVWDTNGNVVQGTTSLAGLWSSGECTSGNGDNQVMYDQVAQRWLLSQFNGSITGQCIAVSATSDPTGSYYLYDFVIDPTGFTDYPKMGKWPVGNSNKDAYFITDNDFVNNFSDVYVNFTAVERDQMLLGNPAQEIVINGPSTNGGGLDYSVLPADLDGSTLPPAGEPGLFANYISPTLFGAGTPYALAMWAMAVNWSTPSGHLYGPRQVAVAPFNDGLCNYSRACIPEPSPGEALDSLGDRLMFRLAYRNLAQINRQVLVTNMTVGTGSPPASPPAGIRWYQLLAPETVTGPWIVWQQGTYLPADGNSRWMGSIAMDKRGNSGMAFSESSSSLDPSVAFTGQNIASALARSDTMDAGETTAVTGSGVQQSTGNRWGDYSSIMTDPSDDCTFWAADEYISSTGTFHWSTYIQSFKFNNCN